MREVNGPAYKVPGNAPPPGAPRFNRAAPLTRFRGGSKLVYGFVGVTMNGFFLSLGAAAFVFVSPAAMGQCGGDTCSVGAAGTGGEMSGDKAQGFHQEFISISRIPGAALTNSGNPDSGHITVTLDGVSLGTASGTFRLNPEPSSRGRGTGLFGDWTGHCDEEDGC